MSHLKADLRLLGSITATERVDVISVEATIKIADGGPVEDVAFRIVKTGLTVSMHS